MDDDICIQNVFFVLLQDNDWGDNTTAVTGLSDLAFPPDAMGKWGEDMSGHSVENIDYDGWRFICQRYMGAWTAAALSILAFFSPILMVILPQMNFLELRESQKKCDVRVLRRFFFLQATLFLTVENLSENGSNCKKLIE